MRVTLLEDVTNLGAKGQIVEVPDGYAENFLFPQFVAVRAEEEKEEGPGRGRSTTTLIDTADEVAAELDGEELLVPMALGKDGKFKAEMNANDIRRVLKDLGHTVEKSLIHVPKGIDEAGEYEIMIGRGPEEDRAKLRVVAEGV